MRFVHVLLAVFLVTLFILSTADASIAGKYSDGQLTVDLADSAGALTGNLSLGNQSFPAVAHASGNNLDGTFTSGANSFPFTATLDADTLTLTTGGKTYTLKRLSPAANPLAQTAAGAGSEPLPGYSVVTSTDFGKAMFTAKPDANSVTTALQSTLPDLAHFFDGRPTVKGAYEDSKSHQSGGAVFTASLKGQPVKGVVSCKLVGKGAAVTVIYCRVDTPPAEWAKLSAEPPPATPAATASPTAAPDNSNLLGDNAQVYQFPDGTGSITLADGWKTQAQSVMSPILIQGPADQNIWIGTTVNVLTPDSPMVKAQRNQDFMGQDRMRGGTGQNAQRPQPFIAQYADPVQAMKDLIPQMSKRNQAAGGPTTNLDEIVSQKDFPSSVPNGKAAIIIYKVTRTTSDGNSKQYSGSQRIQISQFRQGSWMYNSTGFVTPVDTFDHDKPVIFAMIKSEKVNSDAVSQKLSQMNQQQMTMIKQQGADIAARQQAEYQQFQQKQAQDFADGQARHDAQEAGYAEHNQQFNEDELQKARNKDNVVEQIEGYRTVYDTQTGLSTTADLSDVNGVVNSLNAAALDPNRFIQIPLRDQQDPIPGQ